MGKKRRKKKSFFFGLLRWRVYQIVLVGVVGSLVLAALDVYPAEMTRGSIVASLVLITLTVDFRRRHGHEYGVGQYPDKKERRRMLWGFAAGLLIAGPIVVLAIIR
jgi:hypothetical protein